jgi:hypothetical protein
MKNKRTKLALIERTLIFYATLFLSGILSNELVPRLDSKELLGFKVLITMWLIIVVSIVSIRAFLEVTVLRLKTPKKEEDQNVD